MEPMATMRRTVPGRATAIDSATAKRSDGKKPISMEQDAQEEVAGAGRVLSALGLSFCRGYGSISGAGSNSPTARLR